MHDDPQSFIRTPRQLIVVVVLAFLVPTIVIGLFAKLVSTTTRTGAGADSMTPESIAERMRPVGRLEIRQAGDSGADAAAPAAAAPAAAAPAAAAPAAAAPAAAAPAAPSAAVDAQALLKKHNCVSCHAVDKKLVGPAYREVAAKYDAGAAGQLVDKVKKGGAGAWGPIPMPPNPAVPDADVKAIVDWILAGAK